MSTSDIFSIWLELLHYFIDFVNTCLFWHTNSTALDTVATSHNCLLALVWRWAFIYTLHMEVLCSKQAGLQELKSLQLGENALPYSWLVHRSRPSDCLWPLPETQIATRSVSAHGNAIHNRGGISINSFDEPIREIISFLQDTWHPTKRCYFRIIQ